MSDLSRVSALKNAKGDTTHFGVYIDEFQTLDPGTVKDNLEKARSSKMYITLSLQSIDQIVSAVESGDGEAMANAIIDTCANFIFHDGSGYDTAEKMSKIIGKSDRYIYRTTSNERPGILSRLVSIDKAMVS
ncbi:MAG: TraG/TraD/VirD4 family protein, partial [Tissierellales bacterium]